MAHLRKWCSYRRKERPYTRISKYRKKSYIRMSPSLKIVRFDMGDQKREFSCTLDIHTKQIAQIRQNAIESGRQSANRLLEKHLGKNDYYFKIRIYPFHIIRENPLAAGAGADRMSTGMQRAFGKPIGIAAQVRKGQNIATMRFDSQHLAIAKNAARRFTTKLPIVCRVVVTQHQKA
ncbi:MAG: 50S ribosomal protein L16 [Nanoarchaeota archaeon]